MSNIQEHLNYQEKMLALAKEGNEEALTWLRDIVRKSADRAPDDDLIKIADFITDFLRQHIKNYLLNN